MRTVEVCIHNRDLVKFLDWVVVPELGLELLLERVMGLKEDEREKFVKHLKSMTVMSCISEDSEYTLVATIFREI
ncbi:hypothetical protein SEA_PHEROBRINE_82 [Gordonia phage Pherobrine]|nr:hypothetical protein SEA_PHEROBRINE_82 [Gordonia phage Pherobrine]